MTKKVEFKAKIAQPRRINIPVSVPYLKVGNKVLVTIEIIENNGKEVVA